jgi:hypothetical protein
MNVVSKALFQKRQSLKKIKSPAQILEEAAEFYSHTCDEWLEYAEDTTDDQGENDFTDKDICPNICISADHYELIHPLEISFSNPDHTNNIPLYILFRSIIIPFSF